MPITSVIIPRTIPPNASPGSSHPANTQQAEAARNVIRLTKAQLLKFALSSRNIRSIFQLDSMAIAGNASSTPPVILMAPKPQKSSGAIHQKSKKIFFRRSPVLLSQMPSLTDFSSRPVQGKRPASMRNRQNFQSRPATPSQRPVPATGSRRKADCKTSIP